MTSSRTVRIEKARSLLSPGISEPGGTWADLGCGDGIFTLALYSLSGPGCEIHAVDQDRRALERLAREFSIQYPQAALHTLQADFTRPLPLPSLDGLLMANSLHFVRDKRPLLTRLAELLKPGGALIVVEYNTSRGNVWVPHPLDENGFLDLTAEVGLQSARILARIPSSFLGEFYAGMAVNHYPGNCEFPGR
jgi:ubiquinone/menaquinone biosynthesis C-methylase UbiE